MMMISVRVAHKPLLLACRKNFGESFGMSRREDYENRTQALLEPIARANGVSIYDVEYIKEGAI